MVHTSELGSEPRRTRHLAGHASPGHHAHLQTDSWWGVVGGPYGMQGCLIEVLSPFQNRKEIPVSFQV